MKTLTRIVLLSLGAFLLISIVATQEEGVTVMDTTPPVESSIAENEEITDIPQQSEIPKYTMSLISITIGLSMDYRQEPRYRWDA
ncbi:hypothetical protein GDO78_016064 [Eleutherodactylus coqui]|uniref:Uncharacterized protein n=1 Tax=Eleutherodactylus coqui TaxID=57060 RepID=A0A8J6JWC0_ELECQ|nr:hypothetical protein GDO78_016064 [Eleutherodactylus coqui]